jgi:hypothetical protein
MAGREMAFFVFLILFKSDVGNPLCEGRKAALTDW